MVDRVIFWHPGRNISLKSRLSVQGWWRKTVNIDDVLDNELFKLESARRAFEGTQMLRVLLHQGTLSSESHFITNQYVLI